MLPYFDVIFNACAQKIEFDSHHDEQCGIINDVDTHYNNGINGEKQASSTAVLKPSANFCQWVRVPSYNNGKS